MVWDNCYTIKIIVYKLLYNSCNALRDFGSYVGYKLWEVMERHNIVHKIKMRRLSKGLSQKEVAEALGITQAQYSKLENSDNEITLTHLMKLVVFLGMKWSDFDASDEDLPKGDLDSADGIKKEVKSISEILTALTKEVENLKKGTK